MDAFNDSDDDSRPGRMYEAVHPPLRFGVGSRMFAGDDSLETESMDDAGVSLGDQVIHEPEMLDIETIVVNEDTNRDGGRTDLVDNNRRFVPVPM